MHFDQPLMLWLLPLVLLAWWIHPRPLLRASSLRWMPADRASRLVTVAERAAICSVGALLVLGLAQPRAGPEVVERIGRGAQVVLLLDRSSSMDQPFAGGSDRQPLGGARPRESKSAVARSLLARFVARRPRDLFAMVLFSTRPIRTIPLSDKQPLLRAAIAAAGVGRGLAETDVGAALEGALDQFEGRPYNSSRVIVLVSDGAATLDMASQRRLRQRLQALRVALYWLYIRSRNGPLLEPPAPLRASAERPEQALHRFFASIDIPYRAWSAEEPSTLEAALEQIARQQDLPMRYREVRPGTDFSRLCYALALGLMMPLAGVVLTDARGWSEQ